MAPKYLESSSESSDDEANRSSISSANLSTEEKANVVLLAGQKLQVTQELLSVLHPKAVKRLCNLMNNMVDNGSDYDIEAVEGMVLLSIVVVANVASSTTKDVGAVLGPILHNYINNIPEGKCDKSVLKSFADELCETKCNNKTLERVNNFSAFCENIAGFSCAMTTFSAAFASVSSVGVAACASSVPLVGSYIAAFSNPMSAGVLGSIGIVHTALLVADIALERKYCERATNELHYIKSYLEEVKQNPQINVGGYREGQSSYEEISKTLHNFNDFLSITDVNGFIVTLFGKLRENVGEKYLEENKIAMDKAIRVFDYLENIKKEHNISQSGLDKFIAEHSIERKKDKNISKHARDIATHRRVQAKLNELVENIIDEGDMSNIYYVDREALFDILQNIAEEIAINEMGEKLNYDFWGSITHEPYHDIENLVERLTLDKVTEYYMSTQSEIDRAVSCMLSQNTALDNSNSLTRKVKRLMNMSNAQKNKLYKVYCNEKSNIGELQKDTEIEKLTAMTNNDAKSSVKSYKTFLLDKGERLFDKISYGYVVNSLPKNKLREKDEKSQCRMAEMINFLRDHKNYGRPWTKDDLQQLENKRESLQRSYDNSISIVHTTLKKMVGHLSYDDYEELLESVCPSILHSDDIKYMLDTKVHHADGKELSQTIKACHQILHHREEMLNLIIDKAPHPISDKALSKLCEILPTPLPPKMLNAVLDKMRPYVNHMDLVEQTQQDFSILCNKRGGEISKLINGLGVQEDIQYEAFVKLLNKIGKQIDDKAMYDNILTKLPIHHDANNVTQKKIEEVLEHTLSSELWEEYRKQKDLQDIENITQRNLDNAQINTLPNETQEQDVLIEQAQEKIIGDMSTFLSDRLKNENVNQTDLIREQKIESIVSVVQYVFDELKKKQQKSRSKSSSLSKDGDESSGRVSVTNSSEQSSLNGDDEMEIDHSSTALDRLLNDRKISSIINKGIGMNR